MGHQRVAIRVTFNPDGHILASFGSDARIRLWDVETDRPVQQLLTDFRSIEHRSTIPLYAVVVFNPAGDRLASTGKDGFIL
jgi:WD40 repeat protein